MLNYASEVAEASEAGDTTAAFMASATAKMLRAVT